MPTKIEWANESWNPITGCSKISEGCTNCYAKKMANRLKGRYGYPKLDPFQLVLHSMDTLNKPLKWVKPRKIFVCSMGDLFHEDLPDWMITQVMDRVLYDGISHHTFMLLTKRPDRALKYFESIGNMQKDFGNVWLGVTVENDQHYDRIETLLQIPAAVRFVSVEPCLSKVDLTGYLYEWFDGLPATKVVQPSLSWCIVGSETGPGARPMNPKWAIDLYDQAKRARTPFFFKKETPGLPVPEYIKVREFPTQTT